MACEEIWGQKDRWRQKTSRCSFGLSSIPCSLSFAITEVLIKQQNVRQKSCLPSVVDALRLSGCSPPSRNVPADDLCGGVAPRPQNLPHPYRTCHRTTACALTEKQTIRVKWQSSTHLENKRSKRQKNRGKRDGK